MSRPTSPCSAFGAIRIMQCPDQLMWYAGKEGDVIPLAKDRHAAADVYWCREPGGLLNVVKKQDAIFRPNAKRPATKGS